MIVDAGPDDVAVEANVRRRIDGIYSKAVRQHPPALNWEIPVTVVGRALAVRGALLAMPWMYSSASRRVRSIGPSGSGIGSSTRTLPGGPPVFLGDYTFGQLPSIGQSSDFVAVSS